MTAHRTYRRSNSWALLAAALPLPIAAFGQSTVPTEEIIVTATRIEKPLNRVAAAISVVDQDTIQQGRQQLAMDEPLRQVPGVFVQNAYNYAQDTRVSIRGFGSRANFGIRGVKILVDGIPETLPDGQGNLNAIDLGATSQIEVLRGPSSSVWGNASGGVINVTTERAPSSPFTEIRVLAGEYDLQKLQLKTGAQRDNFGYLISLSDSSYDGYRANSRAEKTLLTGRFNFSFDNDSELSTVVSFTDQPVTEDPGGITAAQATMDPRSARDLNISFNAGEAMTQTRLGLLYSLPMGEGHELTARGYYLTRDFENFLPFVAGGNVAFDRTFLGGGLSYTIESNWGGKDNTLIVGLDIDQQDDDRSRFDNNMGVRGPLALDQNEAVDSVGFFVQDDLRLSETVTLSFGARFDEVEFDVTDRFLSDGDDSGVVTLDDVSPMVGIAVDLTDRVSVYGTYSSAFETPTTTEFNRPDGGGGFNDALNPQVARNLEVGLRGRAGDRSRYEVAVFNIKVDDELIPFEVPTAPGRDYFDNAGESSRNGVEFSFSSALSDRLSAMLSYTYADYEYDSFVDDGGNNFGGNRIPGTAEDVFFGNLSYNHPRGWYAAFDLNYVGDQFVNNANSVSSDSYTLGNLRFGWEHDRNSLVIAPFVGINNLFDETYTDNVRINSFGGRYFEPGPERNIYVGASLRFR